MAHRIQDPAKPDEIAVMIFCPACQCGHGGWSKAGKPWSWNGDTERPTITPSILIDEMRGKVRYVCHSVVTAGVIDFLGDCTHALAGQKVALEPF